MQRKFRRIGSNGSWIFGEGTKNIQGDYYVNNVYKEPSIFTMDSFHKYPTLYEEVIEDPDLVMDEGL